MNIPGGTADDDKEEVFDFFSFNEGDLTWSAASMTTWQRVQHIAPPEMFSCQERIWFILSYWSSIC